VGEEEATVRAQEGPRGGGRGHGGGGGHRGEGGRGRISALRW
jgi:hypothetical protein